jgi:hypothetical protein
MSNVSQKGSRSEARVIAEPRLTDPEARATLRRQFIGSVAAAVVVMAMTGFAAMRPAHENSTGSSHRLATVQQPTFVALSDRLIALKQH